MATDEPRAGDDATEPQDGDPGPEDAVETDGADETDGTDETVGAGEAVGADEATGTTSGRVSRRKVLIGGATVAAAGGLAVWGGLRLRAPAEDLVAHRVDALPLTDPDDAAWDRARAARIPLEPQQMVPPQLAEGALTELEARALFDGRDLGVRLTWDDDAADVHEGIALFQDAAAVMLPAVPGGESPPPIFMGWEDDGVYIAQWRASWQKDLDEGYQDVEHLFPGWYSDVHHEHETLVELGLDAETASVFAPARDVGNPLAQRERTSPIEELTAQGYGTLTHANEQRSQGRGVHRDGRWSVTIGVPSGGPAPELSEGTTLPVAFAVWRGERGEVGGRKHHSQWAELALP